VNKLAIKSFSFAMSYACNSNKVRKAVDALNITPSSPAYVGTMGLRVTAVNLRARRYRNINEFVEDINSYVEEAVKSGSCLVAFPEITGLLALSAAPGFDSLFKEAVSLLSKDTESANGFRFLCESTQGYLSDLYHNTFSAIARAHGILIDAGSLYLSEGGVLKNRRYLFSETGTVAGMQEKIFLHPIEISAGVRPGTHITPAATRLGPIALLSRRDAPHFEPFAVAAALGCSLALLSASPFDSGDISFFARCRASEHRLSIVASGLIGNSDYGASFCLDGGIYAPRETTRSRSGILAGGTKKQNTAPRSYSARIDPIRAAEFFDVYSSDKNPRFFRALVE
jgi:predicted amidohydrolase